MSEGENRIDMKDKSEDTAPPPQDSAPSIEPGADNPLGFTPDPPEKKRGGPDAFLGSYGNSAGDKIQSGLSPVGKPLGEVLGMAGKPVGGLVEPLVGGLMKSGSAFGDASGVGAGNMDHKKAAEEEQLKKPVGGLDQTGENPLGLGDENAGKQEPAGWMEKMLGEKDQ